MVKTLSGVIQLEGLESAALSRRRDLVAEGRCKFQVMWSVIVTTTKKFTKPKIEKIKHVSTDWEQQGAT